MKNIKNYIIFFFVLLLLVYGLRVIIDYEYRKHNFDKISLLMKHEIDDNVMIFGSSVAHVHFDPAIIKEQTGLSAYNMGWDGVFFVQYNGLIKEYLSYEKKCKFIVLACDFDNLGKNDLMTRPDLFYAYLSNPNIYTSLHDIEPAKIEKAYYLPGYKFTLLTKFFYGHLLSHKSADTNKGYEPGREKWAALDTFKSYNAIFEEPIYKNLKTTIDEITQKGIKVVMVMTPVYKDGYKLILNADKIKSYYQKLTNSNVYFMDDTQDSLTGNKEYFHNNTHMNNIGATIFSNMFASRLKKIMDSTSSH